MDIGHRVFIDSCAVNGFALLNVRPVRTLTDTAFALAITPDLGAAWTVYKPVG